jgi:hypothetical protein
MTLFMMVVRSSDSGDQAISHFGLNERASKVKWQFIHKCQLQNITLFHHFDKQNNTKLFTLYFYSILPLVVLFS